MGGSEAVLYLSVFPAAKIRFTHDTANKIFYTYERTFCNVKCEQEKNNNNKKHSSTFIGPASVESEISVQDRDLFGFINNCILG